MRHGFTAERLMKLARKIANDALLQRGGTPSDRFEDLVSHLQIVGLQAALKFDPLRFHEQYGKNGGEPFGSYVADVMTLRVADFFRMKREGFGDRRRGLAGLVELSDDPDPADHDVDFEDLVDERRRAKWQRAAELSGWNDLSQFVVATLDIASEAVLAA